MTTGRINQVACRAARDAPIFQGRRARPAAPPTERRVGAKHARSDAPKQMGASPHARLAPNRAGCSTCVRSVFNGLGSHARPLSRESRRARRRNRRRRAPRERSAAGRRTESPLRPAEHPLATRGAQHTETRATPDRRAPHWQGREPKQPGAHRSNSAKHDPGCGRAVGHAVQGHPHRNPLGWVAARTPAARVGLHQTLANSRETIHTIPRNALARARPAPIEPVSPNSRLPKRCVSTFMRA